MVIHFNMPVDVVMQSNCASIFSKKYLSLGSRAVLVTDTQRTESWAVDNIATILENNGTPYTVFFCEEGKSLFATAEAIARCAEEQPDSFLLAVGGEQVIHCSKLASVLRLPCSDDSSVSADPVILRKKKIPVAVFPTSIEAYHLVSLPTVELPKTDIPAYLTDLPEIYVDVALVDPEYFYGCRHDTLVDALFQVILQATNCIITSTRNSWPSSIAANCLSGVSFVLMDLLEDASFDISRLLYYGMATGIAANQTEMSGLSALSCVLMERCSISQGRAVGLILAQYLTLAAKRKPLLVEEILSAMAIKDLEDLKQKCDMLIVHKPVFSEEEILTLAQQARELFAAADEPGCIVLSAEEYASILRQI